MSWIMNVQCKALRSNDSNNIDSFKVRKTYHAAVREAPLHGLVIIARVETPVPIPNTTVKRADADGTMP